MYKGWIVSYEARLSVFRKRFVTLLEMPDTPSTTASSLLCSVYAPSMACKYHVTSWKESLHDPRHVYSSLDHCMKCAPPIPRGIAQH